MSFLKKLFGAIALTALSVGAPSDVMARGPNEVVTGSYNFAARDEPLVATDRMVDLWAEIYRPKSLGRAPMPVLIFLHGNHATCGRYDEAEAVRVDDRSDYTRTGACPAGYVVAPNHLGYGYLAEELASWGYLVVSINANRGVTAGSSAPGDRGLNLMRGRLILRHLALLSDWNRGRGAVSPPNTIGFDPRGAMDFSQVGMMGHSRGGEGVRAALQQYRDQGNRFASLIEPMTIRSLFEIGPVDGQTDRKLDANGVNSMILLPGCDGDVFNLQGMKVFDRVFTRVGRPDRSQTFHGTFMVWGANHNAYNTEWLRSDADGCRGSNQIFPASGRSKPQQTTAFETVVPFFRATVGVDADPKLADLFDPNVELPDVLTQLTNYDRGYLRGPINSRTRVLEGFSNETGLSDDGVPIQAVGVDVVHQRAAFEHDPATRVATVSWDNQSPDNRYMQIDFPGRGLDLSGYKTFAFRTALRCNRRLCERLPSERGEMNYSVALVGPRNQFSKPVRMVQVARISRPVGPNFAAEEENPDEFLHATLLTIQIPMEQFTGVDLSDVRSVRFTFQGKPFGVVDIGDLTASTYEAAAGRSDEPVAAIASSSARLAAAPKPKPAPTAGAEGNKLAVVVGGGGAGGRTAAPAAPPSVAAAASVDIVLTSKRPFPVTGAFPKLRVGKKTIEGGDISPDGKTMTINVPSADFDKLDKGADVSLFVQTNSSVWRFGQLSK